MQHEQAHTPSDIVTRLTSEEGIVIEQSFRENAATHINFDRFKDIHPVAKSNLEKAAKFCVEYVSGPVIRDMFGNDHDRRRLWRVEMSKKYGAAFTELDQKNKLRLNRIGGVVMHLGTLQEAFAILDPESEYKKELFEIVKELPDSESLSRYSRMSDEEKLTVMHQVTRIAERFLNSLEK